MNPAKLACGSFALVIGLGVALAGWESYVPRTIQSVIEAHKAKISSDTTYTADNFATRASVVYQGKIQAIPPSRLKFLGEYLGKFRGHPEWISNFSEEILCRENGKDFWLPIQAGVLRYFRDEVSPGATVDVFVTWVGALKTADRIDWVFTVNEFQLQKAEAK